jgi:hypothetical protein
VGRFGLARDRFRRYFTSMPQVQLPLFPVGTTHLNDSLAFEGRDGRITYFTVTRPFSPMETLWKREKAWSGVENPETGSEVAQ